MMARLSLKNVSVSYFVNNARGNSLDHFTDHVGGRLKAVHWFNEVQALKNVSMEFHDGDRVGLIGINGSGKSTLLKACAGALELTSGSIETTGSISPQFRLGSGLQANLSGVENVVLKCLYFGFAKHDIEQLTARVREVSELGPYLDLPLKTYSAGMRTRLLMGLLTLLKGDILLFDEWIGAADEATQKKMTRLQSELTGDASVTIIASHSKRVLFDWADKGIWMHKGQIREIGDMQGVFTKYIRWVRSK